MITLNKLSCSYFLSFAKQLKVVECMDYFNMFGFQRRDLCLYYKQS